MKSHFVRLTEANVIDHFNLPFFSAALAAGATSNGSPGARQQYDPQYYAAFVLGPDGHNVEAVFRGSP
jgi:hypothetical protein